MSTGHQEQRPTAEEWHRVASALAGETPRPKPAAPVSNSNPKPAKPQPAPPGSQQPTQAPAPEISALRLSRTWYWIAVVAITPLALVIAAMMRPSPNPTLLEDPFIRIFLMMYLPIAILRARDMGYNWFASVALSVVAGALFLPFLLMLLGITKSKTTIDKLNSTKVFLIGIAAFFAIMAVIIVVAITLIYKPSWGSQPDQRGLTACDTWLRAQLRSSTATPNTHATNDAIEAIQAGRPAQCPPGAWNPVVNDLGRDHLGNIDVKFWTANTNLRGTAVTMPADGTPRWVYLAEKKQWYSSKLDDRSVLTTPPTISNQSAPTPTTARPNYTSRPTPTDPMSLLMWITEGEVGSIGQALDCDNLLQQQFLASPLATANEDNANAVIAGIQAQRPSDCPPDTWNPVVQATAQTTGFPVNVPPTLSTDGLAGTAKAFANTPWRDNLGNIGVDFTAASSTLVRGSPTTLPLDRGARWMYLAAQGVWYAANTPAPLLMPTATAGALWTAPTSNALQNVVSPTLQTVHTLGIPTLAIIGQVKNVTGRRMGFIQANCQVYVGDIQVASTTTFTNSLAPGAKWQYQADLFDNTLQGSNYNIECLFDEW